MVQRFRRVCAGRDTFRLALRSARSRSFRCAQDGRLRWWSLGGEFGGVGCGGELDDEDGGQDEGGTKEGAGGERVVKDEE